MNELQAQPLPHVEDASDPVSIHVSYSVYCFLGHVLADSSPVVKQEVMVGEGI